MSAADALDVIRRYETGNDVRQVISCSEGGRALRLLKRREETSQQAAEAKRIIEEETKKRKFSSIDQKFGGSSADILEEEFKKQTVGLMSVEEFKAKRKAIDDIIEKTKSGDKDKTWRSKRKVNGAKLSFKDPEDGGDSSDEEEEEDDKPFKKSFGKDPSVDTSFLFDGDREADVVRKRKELTDEYNRMEEQAKKEKLEVTYSYWDGSGHRRSCMVEKGFTIGVFLNKAKLQLEKSDFPELRTVGLDNLMYVKEDLIIPQNVTFHELIKEKARGKSGPLFNFDVHDDVRTVNDVRVEKDESHAGKIVDRKWYERNKHIFPACRWEQYSKDKTFDQFTVSGDADHSRVVPSRNG